MADNDSSGAANTARLNVTQTSDCVLRLVSLIREFKMNRL